MRHFAFLDERVTAALFEHRPGEFTADSDSSLLAVALGATLYMPGTRPHLARDVQRRSAAGVVSVVLCLEDSIADEDVLAAEANVVAQVRLLAAGSTRAQAPLLFLRVRTAEQITDLVDRLGPAATRLSGFVLPKFTAGRGAAFFDHLAKAEELAGVPLLVMPVLESGEVMYRETRGAALEAIRALLQLHRDRVLAVRLGAADFSGLYALRRQRDVSIYDVGVLRDVIADIVNVLGRADGTGLVITGPVWEHYGSPERLFKPLLRRSLFADDVELRHRLVLADHDELLREVVLDHANGLLGKTVIHPAQVAPIHGLMVVLHEEYADAQAILAASSGGASGSAGRSRMNEAGPHRAWAQNLLRRAEVFGVARPGLGVVDVLAALLSSPELSPAGGAAPTR